MRPQNAQRHLLLAGLALVLLLAPVPVLPGDGSAPSSARLAPGDAQSAESSASLALVTDDLGVTEANPNRGVSGLDLSTALALGQTASASFGLSYSRNRPSAAAGVPFAAATASVLALRAGLSVTPDPHLILSAAASYSPTATSNVVIPLSGVASGTLNLTGALVSVEGSARSAQATLSLSSAGDGAIEHQLDLSAGLARMSNREQVLRFSDASGPVDSARVQATCTVTGKGKKKTRPCERIEPLLPSGPQTADVDQTSLGGAYTMTLDGTTSIAVNATRYIYPGTDPSTVGFFPVATAGRTSVVTTGHGRNQVRSTVTTPGLLLQGGVALAALAYDFGAELGRDLGSVRLDLSAGYGRYYHLAGGERWGGAQLTFGAGKPWQLAVAGQLGRSDDADGVSVSDLRLQAAVTHRF